MQVKVHPHKTRIRSGVEASVSITPTAAGGRARYAGSVVLRNVRFRIQAGGLARARAEQVRNVHAWAVGEEAFTHPVQGHDGGLVSVEDMLPVRYHFNDGRFVTDGGVDVTDAEFDFAVVWGGRFFVSAPKPSQHAPAAGSLRVAA